MKQRSYLAIDLKSFYASVECMDRNLDPLTANLVVADESRTEKTICLAVSPALKSYGIPGRARLFEVVQRVKTVNAAREKAAPGGRLAGSSIDSRELVKDPALAVDYVVAPPRMAHYVEISTQIYNTYLRFIAPEDIHVYSIDEVFIDATNYLKTYRMTPRELAMKLILEVLKETGITATAGVGTNLYLAKVAMDIEAKHIPPDENGVRIAELDEMSYRRKLWSHRPLTDFWRVGSGLSRKLEAYHLETMGDIARCSLGGPGDCYNEDLLYRMFGVNAELLIDHAWGWEPCTIADIKAYKPETNSLSSGQVLTCPYTAEKAALVVREMADAMAMDLLGNGLVADQLTLTVVYDTENLTDPGRMESYRGEIVVDRYGRKMPKQAHGSFNLKQPTASTRLITTGADALYRRIVNEGLLVRRIYLGANHVISESAVEEAPEQLDLFTDHSEEEREKDALERERRRQKAVLAIQKKFGRNAILKGISLEEGATARERNGQIGGHKA